MRFLLLIFFVVSSPVFAQVSNSLVGTWKLISSESMLKTRRHNTYSASNQKAT